MGPLLSGLIAASEPGTPPPDNPILLIYRLFRTFALVPLPAVLGQHVLSSLCWATHSIPVCAAHDVPGYLLTYLATIIGLFLLSPYWIINRVDVINEPAWLAVQFAASPLGSLTLWWVMDSPNPNGPHLLDAFWILLAMAVGQGIIRAVSHYALPRYHQGTTTPYGCCERLSGTRNKVTTGSEGSPSII